MASATSGRVEALELGHIWGRAGRTLLYPLLIRVTQRIVGKAPAAFFEEVTGISHTTFHRVGYAAAHRRLEEVEIHRRKWFCAQLQLRSATKGEVEALLAEWPDVGLAAQWSFGLGLLGPEASSTLRGLVARLDEADVRLSRAIAERDEEAVLHELGPLSPLGADYHAPLDVAGVGPGPYQAGLTRRAHMALSLLAAIDHEIGHWNTRVFHFDPWVGMPRFSILLSEPGPATCLRQTPDDPYARLVDFVGACGHAFRHQHWPDRSLTIGEMGAQAEASSAVQGDGTRFVRGLRSGKTRLTAASFRQLVRGQFARDARKRTPEIEEAADFLAPYLFAAHLLTCLMPGMPGKAHHRDRSGWRAAYLAWWQKYAETEDRPAGQARLRPPHWLTGS